MMRRIARITTARIARVALGLALVAAGLAVLPATAATASSNIVAYWSNQPDPLQIVCSDPGTYTYGSKAVEVYNPCDTKVWLHYYDNQNGKIYAYCVNPGGGLAYDFSKPYSDLQLTNVKSPCWASNAQFSIGWWSGGFSVPSYYTWHCEAGQTFTNTDGGPGKGSWVYSVSNNESNTNEGAGTCDFRIWLHQYDNGTGNSACLDPGGTLPPGIFPNGGGYTSPVYWQVAETLNQVPCNAGGPPYSY